MSQPADHSMQRKQTGMICLVLALVVLAAYGRLLTCDFVVLDDSLYVTSNNIVKQGLTWPGIGWAFTSLHAVIWHPLTWLSFLVDSQLYGTSAAGYHFTNLLLHLANSILLFLLLQRMTRAAWPSALTAAFFALHPLHVESVAWISERKDVLSTFFWMLTVWCYIRYAAPGATLPTPPPDLNLNLNPNPNPSPRLFYFLSLIFFAMGLMSKPMLVTLPFILLLLDYWPLQRKPFPNRALLLEKIRFLLLAVAACVVGVLVARQANAMESLAGAPLAERLANVPVSYARYVGKTFWPVGLTVLYPQQAHWQLWQIAGATAFLALATVLVFWRARAEPYLVVGWLWFLGALVPVIGLVQAGGQDIADHHTYIPLVGLFIMVIWSVRERSRAWPPILAPGLSALAIAACLALTTRQLGYWKGSRELLSHALACTANNSRAWFSLGTFYASSGQTAAAIAPLQEAVRLDPSYGLAQNNLGKALFQTGRVDEALDHLTKAVRLNAALPEFHYNLGNALLAEGRVADALEQFETQVNLNPQDPTAQFNFGRVLLENRLVDDAIPHLEVALQLNPNDPDCAFLLGNALLQGGHPREAIAAYQRVLQLRPDHVRAAANLAWILAGNPDPSLRDGAKAVALASHASQLAGGNDPLTLAALGAAYAELRNFSEAIASARRALQLANLQTNFPLASTLRSQIALYQTASPFRDTNQTGSLALPIKK